MVKPNPDLDLVFRALSDPTRRAIVDALSRGERNVTELAKPFDMSLAAVSKHLKVLEEAGLVARTWEGRAARCRLDPGPLASANEWLSHYRAFWEGRFDALAHVLKAKKEKKTHG